MNTILNWPPESLPSTGEDVQRMAEETVREIASIAWKGAANAYRMYPDNKHTFSGYWEAAKNQFSGYAAHPPAPSGMEEAVSVLPEFSQYLINEINGYQKTRDGWKEGSQNFEAYDLVVRVLRIIADKYLKMLSAFTPHAKEQTSQLPGVDNKQVKPSDPQMVKEMP